MVCAGDIGGRLGQFYLFAQVKLLNSCAGVSLVRRLVGVSGLGGLVSGLFLDGMVSSALSFWDSEVFGLLSVDDCEL